VLMCCLYVMIMAFRRCCRKMIAQDGSLSSRKRHEHAHPKKMSVYRLKLRLSSWKYSLQQTTRQHQNSFTVAKGKRQ
jgi:hypothetical protein